MISRCDVRICHPKYDKVDVDVYTAVRGDGRQSDCMGASWECIVKQELLISQGAGLSRRDLDYVISLDAVTALETKRNELYEMA